MLKGVLVYLYTFQTCVIFNITFIITANKRFFREGETGTVSWTMTRYSENERYSIFHKDKNIIKVSKQNASSLYPDKYVYQETPSDPRRGGFQIINVSLPDSGVYTGGSLRPLAEDWAYVIVYGKDRLARQHFCIKIENNVWKIFFHIGISCLQCSYIFKGNPLKPKIIGQTKVDVGNYVTLKCLSVSTSLPNNYKRYPSITYKWFKNGNFIIRSGNILRLKVEEELYKDKITCQAKEVVSSTLSDSVQIEKPNCKYPSF